MGRQSNLVARMGLIVLLLSLGASLALAQTRSEGPWWPHSLWGPDDQAGGSNWITPAKVLEAIRLIKTGEVYELGHVYERGMPLFGQRTYSMFIAGSPTYPPLGKNSPSDTTISSAPRSATSARSSTGWATSAHA